MHATQGTSSHRDAPAEIVRETKNISAGQKQKSSRIPAEALATSLSYDRGAEQRHKNALVKCTAKTLELVSQLRSYESDCRH